MNKKIEKLLDGKVSKKTISQLKEKAKEIGEARFEEQYGLRRKKDNGRK